MASRYDQLNKLAMQAGEQLNALRDTLAEDNPRRFSRLTFLVAADAYPTPQALAGGK